MNRAFFRSVASMVGYTGFQWTETPLFATVADAVRTKPQSTSAADPTADPKTTVAVESAPLRRGAAPFGISFYL